MTDNKKKMVLVGIIGAPHGIRGDLRVKAYTDDPLALGDYGRLYDSDGNGFDVLELRPSKTVIVVRFQQVTSRKQAEALNGTELFIPRETLDDASLEDGEFFIDDLVGLVCISDDGTELGTVTAVDNYGAGDILEVRMVATGKKELFVFDARTVPDVDLTAGQLTLVPPGEIIVQAEAKDDTGDKG